MEDEKKFNQVEIIILVMLAMANDLLLVFAVMVFAIPVVGQVLGAGMEVINLGLWAVITGWFIFKTKSFGKSGVLQIAGGIAEFFGIPGRTATVIAGILIENNPKLSKVAGLATGAAAAVATDGASLAVSGAAASGAVAAEGAAVAEGAVAAGETAAIGASATAKGVASQGAAKAELSAAEKTIERAKEEEKVFGGETKTPTEQVQEELLGEEPLKETEMPEEEEPVAKKASDNLPKKDEKEKEKVPAKKTEEREKEEGDEAPEEPAEEKELTGSQLGGAYAEEEKIRKSMEEVEIEGNSVDLRGADNSENNNVLDARERFGSQNKNDAEKPEKRLAA